MARPRRRHVEGGIAGVFLVERGAAVVELDHARYEALDDGLTQVIAQCRQRGEATEAEQRDEGRRRQFDVARGMGGQRRGRAVPAEVDDLGVVDDDRFVVLHMHKHNPPQVRELADVSEQIAGIIKEQSAREMVAAEADRLMRELAAGASIEQLANSAGYDWQVELGADRRNTSLPPDVLSLAFGMPAPAEGEVLADFVMTPAGDAQVVALVRVNPGRLETLDEPAVVALRRQLNSEYANLLDTEFQRGLRESADVSVM